MGTSGRNFVESVARVIPGYRGYSERESRRDMDRLVRETIAKRIEAAQREMDAAIASCSRSGALDQLEPLEALRRRAAGAVNRLRHATGGYSGFFDTVQVEEAELERVHEHDARMSEQAEALRAAATALATSPGAEEVRNVDAALDRIEDQLLQRDNVLKGVQ